MSLIYFLLCSFDSRDGPCDSLGLCGPRVDVVCASDVARRCDDAVDVRDVTAAFAAASENISIKVRCC